MFIARLQGLGYHTATFRLNMSTWVDDPPRDRLFVIFVKDELGGAAAIEYFKSAVQDPLASDRRAGSGVESRAKYTESLVS